MVSVHFTDEDRQALNYERFHYPDPRVQQKIEALWLVSQGLDRGEVARLAGISVRTVRRYVKRYKRGGIEALKRSDYHKPQSELDQHAQTLKEYFEKKPPSTVKQAQAAIETLTGIRVHDDASARRAVRDLRHRGIRTVILTLGERGACVAADESTTIIPGFRVKAVDTVAAGDVFNGALAVASAEGRSLPESVRFAHAAAALSVTRLGAQSSAPSREEIDRFLHGNGSVRRAARL